MIPSHAPGGTAAICIAGERIAIVRGAGGLLTDAAGVAIDYRRPTLANERGVLAAGLALHGRGVEVLAPFVPGASPSRACRSAPS